MEASTIEGILGDAERATDAGAGLRGTGFWKAVGAVKRDPDLVARFGERISAIDRRAFIDWALVTMPIVPGTILMALATIAGFALVGVAYLIEGQWPPIIVFAVGFGILFVTTHGLAHLIVGRVVGIRFTHWFIGTIWRPQPGVKIDYVSYLNTSPEARAWMHASGAIVSKTVPFLLIGAAIASGLPAWVSWGLALIGVVSIATDILWSTTKSDWKKFRREMEIAQAP